MAQKPLAKMFFSRHYDITVFGSLFLAVCAGIFVLPDAIYYFLTWSAAAHKAEKIFVAVMAGIILILAYLIFFLRRLAKKH